MAKVLEGPGMGLMKKWGISVPNYVVVTSVDELAKLGQANEWLKKSKLVVKAHEALGSRFKLGLVKVDLDLKEAEAATDEMIGRQVGSITVSQVIVSEMILHKEEYYCAVKSTREGTDILVANCGGIEVESNWERVKRLALEVGQQPSADALEKLAKDAGFVLVLPLPDALHQALAPDIMARRIAAIVLLEPALDANYQTIKNATYPWPALK